MTESLTRSGYRLEGGADAAMSSERNKRHPSPVPLRSLKAIAGV